MMQTDRLVEINREDLRLLRSFYTPNSFKNVIACMTIDNYIRWFEEDPEIEGYKFFCLNGDFSDGTFILLDSSFAYAETMSSSFENLTRLLQLIDHSQTSYTFANVPAESVQVFKNVLQKANVEISNQPALMYFLPKEEALKFDSRSSDVELRPLKEYRDLVKANALWDEHFPDTLPFFQRTVRFNPNIGAFTKDGTLASSVVICILGMIGALKTDEKYGGRGYGSLVVRHLSKLYAEMGYDLFAAVYEGNIPSQSMFSKLGFKPVAEVFYITTKH